MNGEAVLKPPGDCPFLLLLRYDDFGGRCLRPAATSAFIQLGGIPRLPEDFACILLRHRHDPARAGGPDDLLLTLAAIGAHGDAARAVGPKLVPLLQPNTLDSGPLAAAVLAHLGYREAIPDLLSAVARTDDWLFVMSAAAAPEQLGAT